MWAKHKNKQANIVKTAVVIVQVNLKKENPTHHL